MSISEKTPISETRKPVILTIENDTQLNPEQEVICENHQQPMSLETLDYEITINKQKFVISQIGVLVCSEDPTEQLVSEAATAEIMDQIFCIQNPDRIWMSKLG